MATAVKSGWRSYAACARRVGAVRANVAHHQRVAVPARARDACEADGAAPPAEFLDDEDWSSRGRAVATVRRPNPGRRLLRGNDDLYRLDRIGLPRCRAPAAARQDAEPVRKSIHRSALRGKKFCERVERGVGRFGISEWPDASSVTAFAPLIFSISGCAALGGVMTSRRPRME